MRRIFRSDRSAIRPSRGLEAFGSAKESRSPCSPRRERHHRSTNNYLSTRRSRRPASPRTVSLGMIKSVWLNGLRVHRGPVVLSNQATARITKLYNRREDLRQGDHLPHGFVSTFLEENSSSANSLSDFKVAIAVSPYVSILNFSYATLVVLKTNDLRTKTSAVRLNFFDLMS